MIKKELQNYIEEFIFPSYEKNDSGHNLDHIMYVIERSLKFAKQVPGINMDMVYTIAAYHDIGHHIDAKNHEKVSAEILLADKNLRLFFNEEQIRIMAEAVEDHRASSEKEPRSIYGKIVSSADRNTRLDSLLKRTYSYRIKHNPNDTLEEVIEESRRHVIDKFGRNGYAVSKMYFDDPEYQEYLNQIDDFTEDREKFRQEFIKANGLDNPLRFYFMETKRRNPNMPLDELLLIVYEAVKEELSCPFDEAKQKILEANKEEKVYCKK